MESPLEVYMKKAEIEEKVKEVLREVSKMPLKDILSYIIKGEKDATDLYTFLYENVPSRYLKEKFRQFMEVEISHDKKVTEIFNTLYPNEEPSDVPFESWTNVFKDREFKIKTLRDYLDILEVAMKSERLAEEVYLYVSKHIPNPEYKGLFIELAKDEHDHYEFLKQEYETYEKAKAEQDFQELIKELMKDKKRA
ncbi:rubrerythrin [Thermococcus barophilus MP]|uniref:Rubrerythrin n=2 Tax=Thermococcus barophilus TaxID=55802 RepID=F0LJ02_THEBM|nr:rubrerythrin [Thermococcus barophilus MP]